MLFYQLVSIKRESKEQFKLLEQKIEQARLETSYRFDDTQRDIETIQSFVSDIYDATQ